MAKGAASTPVRILDRHALPGRLHEIVTAICGAVLLTAGGVAQAQTWSFDQIVKQAVQSHPAVLAKRSSSLSAKADVEGASWQRYPTPSVEAGSDSKNTRTALFRLQQPLWTGGRITAGIESAQSRFQAAETAVNETQQDVVVRSINAFVEALRQQARQETVARGVQQHERLLELIGRRVQQEASPRVDQDLAQSRLLQANNDLSTVQQSLANALTQLSQLTGKPVSRVLPLDLEALAVPASKDAALEQAVARSPTLRRLAFEEQAAQSEVEAKKAAYMPQLSLRMEHGYASAPLNGIPAYTTNRVLIVIEAQPGAGLSAVSGVESAVAKLDAARQQRETAIRELQERVSLDWDELTAARTRLQNATVASRSAQEVYESYTRQYTAGRKTWLDVLNSVRESTQSDVAVLDANGQATGAALRLELATGQLTGIFK